MLRIRPNDVDMTGPNGSAVSTPIDIKRRLRSDLRLSLGEGTAFGAMVGLGETYLPAFVLAVGLGEVTAGLIASVPLVVGRMMQMVSPRAVAFLRSHRRWVVLCAIVQALTFLPLTWAAVNGRISTLAVFCAATVYWGGGLATGPAWNTWIGAVVPGRLRAQFFAVRTRLSQAAVFAGFLVGGLALEAADYTGHALGVFALMFLTAGLCRLASATMLNMQSEPAHLAAATRRAPLREVGRQLRSTGGTWLLGYLVAVQAAVQMAGPYFTPFMLEKLEFSYGLYASLLSAAFLAKIISLPTWGRLVKRIGTRRLLWIGGVGIVPLSGMWLVSTNIWWLLLVQIYGGAVWAAYELAFFLLFFESIPERDRTGVLTLYNLANTVAWVGGSLVGGVLLHSLGATAGGYLTLFGLSTVARGTALVLLTRVSTAPVEAGGMGMRTVAVRPSSASLDAPVLPSLPDQTHQRVKRPA